MLGSMGHGVLFNFIVLLTIQVNAKTGLSAVSAAVPHRENLKFISIFISELKAHSLSIDYPR